MRVFLAIDLPEKIKRDITKYQQNLNLPGKVKLVQANQLHITLFFWDNLNKEKQIKVEKAIEKITTNFKTFILRIEKLSGFPGPKKARIVFLNLEGKKIQTLHKIIKKELCQLTYQIPVESRKFIPHLTLARLRLPVNIQNYSQPKKEQFKVKQITLYQSKLSAKGAIHKPIKEFKLSEN